MKKKTKYITLCLVSSQLLMAFYTQHIPLFWWLITIYIFGATVNHSIFTAIHEVTHNLAFKSKLANKYFAIFINLPLGIPVAMGFEKYHSSHHLFLGDIKKDVDIPFLLEARIFNSRIGKFLWLFLQPITYPLRPLIKWPQKISRWEWLNIIAQLLFDILIVYLFSWKLLVFLVLSTLIGMGLHPLATHFIAEHYVTHGQQETYSYYGPLNFFIFNFGYHVEHHDFPTIPWSRISLLRKIAPEYYQSLYSHTSWLAFMRKFIFSKHINLLSRIVRYNREGA